MNQSTVFLSTLAVGCALSFVVGRTYFGSAPSADTRHSADSNSELAKRQSFSPRNEQRSGDLPTVRLRPTRIPRQNPMERLEVLNRIGDPLERSEALLELAKRLNAPELEELITHLQTEGEELHCQSFYFPLMDAWVRANPQSALNHTRDHISDQATRKIMISTWASADPGEALEWAKKEDNRSYSWTAGIVPIIAVKDLDLATNIVTNMRQDGHRVPSLHALLNEAMKQGDEAAREWAAAIKDDSLSVSAVRMLALAQAKIDPLGAADWLLASPHEDSKSAIAGVMSTMAQADSDAAIGYMNRISDPAIRSMAMKGITKTLSHDNPRAAIELINANPSPEAELMVAQVIMNGGSKEPELAANLLGRAMNAITESGAVGTRQIKILRHGLYHKLLNGWLEKDYGAAIKWINENDLPPEELDSINDTIQRIENRQQ